MPNYAFKLTVRAPYIGTRPLRGCRARGPQLKRTSLGSRADR